MHTHTYHKPKYASLGRASPGVFFIFAEDIFAVVMDTFLLANWLLLKKKFTFLFIVGRGNTRTLTCRQTEYRLWTYDGDHACHEYKAMGFESSTGEIKISRNIATYSFYSWKAILHRF
jgi:hypothetical protein